MPSGHQASAGNNAGYERHNDPYKTSARSGLGAVASEPVHDPPDVNWIQNRGRMSPPPKLPPFDVLSGVGNEGRERLDPPGVECSSDYQCSFGVDAGHWNGRGRQ